MKLNFLTLPIVSHAETIQIPQLTTVISNITDTITWIMLSVLVLIVLNFGVQFLLASDNPQERVRLKHKIIWTLVGLFIIIAAKPISSWLQSII